MFIFEITKPGSFLDYDDKEWCWRVSGLLSHLENIFYEANIALNLFHEEFHRERSFDTSEQSEKYYLRLQEIVRELRMQRRTMQSDAVSEDVYSEAYVKLNREKWASGIPPVTFTHGVIFIYAKAFIYALDNFEKFLKVISKEPCVPDELNALHHKMKVLYPSLREVRNSAHHQEDRARGLGVGGKVMDLKPINNDAFKSNGGSILVLNSLIGTRYGSTLSDGSYGEVDVTPESLQSLRDLLISILCSFKWTGPEVHLPR